MKKKIAFAVLGFLVVAQFFRIDKTLPESDPAATFKEVAQPDAALAELLETSCYDCHGNHTTYPWYSNIAPVSWWLQRHVKKGRAALNFDEWGAMAPQKRAHKLEESAEFVEETKMPIFTYTLAHPKARLSKEERARLVELLKKMTTNE